MQSKSTKTFKADNLHIAVIVSDYHSTITQALLLGAKKAFSDAGGKTNNLSVIHATGAWELPILAKSIAIKGNVDAIVTLGCILTGETTHDRIIGEAIANGLMNISLEWGHPVAMGVLTCQTIEQAEARSGGTSGNKGIESMLAAIGTATALKELHD
jgi:6,7-dimethyl-8-ribityllumazine synthase